MRVGVELLKLRGGTVQGRFQLLQLRGACSYSEETLQGKKTTEESDPVQATGFRPETEEVRLKRWQESADWRVDRQHQQEVEGEADQRQFFLWSQ